MLMACAGPGPAGSSATSAPPGSAPAGINNPSDARGGTLRFANSADWDSLDPADTYYTYAWNFARLYGRSLVTFKSAPGAEGATLVPDLAESLGTPNADATQWTYTLRPGVKFEDGSPITSRDVKYAVERSLDKSTFPNGPTYLNDFLDIKGYTGPYSDPDPNKLGLAAVDTPDDRTIVFTRKTPFSVFDYFAQLPATMPVPIARDTGTAYKEHVVSTGPYMFESVQPGARLTLVRNPNWDPATDPVRKALPDRIEVSLNVNADDIDNQLISGGLDVGVDGAGLGRAAQGRVLTDPALRANVDSAPAALLWYTALSASVPPLRFEPGAELVMREAGQRLGEGLERLPFLGRHLVRAHRDDAGPAERDESLTGHCGAFLHTARTRSGGQERSSYGYAVNASVNNATRASSCTSADDDTSSSEPSSARAASPALPSISSAIFASIVWAAMMRHAVTGSV
jgi:peptide/nickel transport system substrate-binding protein